MKLVAYDKTKLDNVGGYKRSKWQGILDEFVNSDTDCAKVEGWTHKSATGAAGSLNTAIKRYNYGNIRAIERKGEVYLIKTKTE